MIFEKGYLYHIYNQGNNRQNIFFSRDNYLLFLKKIHIYVSPYTDVIAWCLMPNHFHLMVLVNEIEMNRKDHIHQMTNNRNEKSHQMNLSTKTCNETLNKNKLNLSVGFTNNLKNKESIYQMAKNHGDYSHQMNAKLRSFNNSIAIMLRTFTRAINKQENRTGSLFKPHTKAECINCLKGVKPSFIQSNISITNLLSEKQYPQICFNYIHQNPVKANLVKEAIDWEFSSAKDYAGLRNGKLVNKIVSKEYVDF